MCSDKTVSHCISLIVIDITTLCSVHIAALTHMAQTSHHFFYLCLLNTLYSISIHPGVGAGRKLELSGSKFAVWCSKTQLLLGNTTYVCIHILPSLKGESVNWSTIVHLSYVLPHKLLLRSVSQQELLLLFGHGYCDYFAPKTLDLSSSASKAPSCFSGQ